MTQGTGEKGNWEGTPRLTAYLVVAPSFTAGELPKEKKNLHRLKFFTLHIK